MSSEAFADTTPLRLALCLPSRAASAAIAARLRGAIAEHCDDLPPGDCVGVALTGSADADAAERLLAKGIHVLLLAEPCPPREAFQQLLRAARSAGVWFSVVNPDRYLPSRRLIRGQLDATLGDPGLIRSHRWESAGAGEAPGLPEPLLRDLDTTLWLTRRPPDRVFAAEPGPAGGGRSLQVHLGFPGGGMALLGYDGRLPPGDGYHSLSVIARDGAAYADDHANVQLAYRGDRPRAVPAGERAGQLAAAVQDFADAIRAGRDPGEPSRWPAVYAAADAVTRSLATGRAVTPEGD